MKKDIVIAIAAVLVVLAVTFGLAQMRPDGAATPSRPFAESGDGEAAPKKSGKVVITVNGEQITESEFDAFLNAVPEQQRAMFQTPAGKRELANELVRMKALEQEAKRRGLEKDPEFQEQLGLLRSQFTAQHALQKIIEERAEKQIEAEFQKQKATALNLRHIVFAYEGGMMPAKGQGKAPSAAEATAKATSVVTRLRGGGSFADIARAESEDPQSAAQGGSLGPLRADALPPDVAGVVTKLKPGEYSNPVRTQFGIHVFSVAEPTLEEMRPSLLAQLQQKIAQEEVKRLQDAAKVDLDPQFFPPAPAAPAGAPGGAAPQPAPRQQ